MTRPPMLSTVKSFPACFRPLAAASIVSCISDLFCCSAMAAFMAAWASRSTGLMLASSSSAPRPCETDRTGLSAAAGPPRPRTLRRPDFGLGGDGAAALAFRAALSLSSCLESFLCSGVGARGECPVRSFLTAAALSTNEPSKGSSGCKTRRRVGTTPRAQLSAVTEAGSVSGSQDSASSALLSPLSRLTKTNWIRSKMSLATT
mmetsp:Transcript_48102/g.80855  ORF Transcript_48102/g.80855 Transcript_48102/m.80855 type:complete len:204 (+) Transcript_48102:1318-1929(+)